MILFILIFFSITELVSIRTGYYALLYLAALEVIYKILSPEFSSQNYYSFVILLIGFGLFYGAVKNLRKRRFEKTSAKEKHFRTLVNYSLQPIILKDERGKVIFASESIKNLLGLEKNLPSGKTLQKYLHPEDVQAHKEFLKQIKNSDFEKKTIELRMKKGNSGWIWVRNDSINLLKHKDIRAIVSSMQDITFQKEIDREKADIIEQEKKARNMAESAVRQRDEFLSIASHELKTPLTTVLLQLQSTLKKILTQSLADFSGEELLNSLQIAEKQSQRLGALIKDLLNVSLASTGKISVNKEKINLSELVKSLVKRYEEEIKLSGCSVKIIVDNPEIEGDWDVIRIEQAISNLLMNALKYSGESEVTIKVKQDNSWALVSIKDKGKGIEEKYQDNIFEPFKRISQNDNKEGLGVGLFIAKQIAKAHGGDIKLKSKPDKGSEFTLKLPLTI